MQLSIEITESQHQQIKERAATSGLSIKDYILEKVLPMTKEEQEAMEQLRAYLAPALAEIERGEFYEGTVEDIIAEMYAQHGLTE